MLSFLIIFWQRNRGSTWGGGNLNSMTSFSSTLGEWLNHIQNILVGASWIAAQIAEEAATVLVHCRFFNPSVSLTCINLFNVVTGGNSHDDFLFLACVDLARVPFEYLLQTHISVGLGEIPRD